ncbi:MAG: diguanylate cyclase [uncultured bacterium (gcode 4)]|uniref:Diguanylate cyclase n=1 Tax=uncultured bacterium (gcode 4) TaxID=1234023 RepID=K2AWN8_9BACT|nr:MAG: diguanylate cyclase [uncultured bacterium (gcode 4)]
MKNKIKELKWAYAWKFKEIKDKIKESTSLYISDWKEIAREAIIDWKEIINNNRIIFGWLVLFTLTHLNSWTINKTYEDTKFWVNKVLNNNLWFHLETSKQIIIYNIYKETIKEVWTEDIYDEKLQKALFEKINKYDEATGTKLLESLLLWFLYWFAYMKTVRRVRDDYMPIDAKTFTTFCLSSWWMVLVNWFVPWSMVYLESFALAWYTVYLHYMNIKNDRKYKFWTIEKMPIPFSSYNSKWKPVIWNEKMEQETWYTFKEVLDYYNEKWEIMSLLYKWEELERVKKYLKKVEDEGIWYSRVAFTMTTKSWELKTFLWTTEPNWQGGNNRFAEYLKNKEEIEEELAKTRELLNEMEEKAMRDKLTWIWNRRALDDHLHNLFTNWLRRNTDPKNIVVALIDIDNFKKYNDKWGHAGWDKVLKEFSLYMSEARNLRPWDWIYRLWWDEFILIFEWPTIEEIIWKLSKVRQDFFEKTWIGTSWWLKQFNVKEYYKKDQTIEETQQIIELIKEEADYYMYSVKYFKCIEEELVAKWIIQPWMLEKNGIAYPIFDENKNLVWAKIINAYWEFTITKEDLDLIEERKKVKTDAEDKNKLENNEINQKEELLSSDWAEKRQDEDDILR